MSRPVNIECFSCAGGMAEGFRRAGITFDFVFDRDPNAVASYTKNLGHAPIQMDVRDLVRMVRGGWSPGPVNLFVADPPCTPWSRAGKRQGLADERDMLAETAELIALLRPRYYLIGNVPGLQDSSSWGVVQRVIGGLARHGYCVADYVSLDAADYGVPQHRIRPFWFGHLEGACIRWPAPTHDAPARVAGALPGLGLRPWLTCREVLQHLPLELVGVPVRHRVNRKHPPSPLDGAANTITTSGHRQCSGGNTLRVPQRLSRHDDPVHSSSADALAWPWDRPATNVYADDRMAPFGRRPAEGIGSIMSSANAIVLSERAAGILQGFPEGWLFAGDTKKARWSQIGQAMPPPPCACRRSRRRRCHGAWRIGGRVRWRLSWYVDPAARVVADRHYNRQTIGAPQFVPPGRCLVSPAPAAPLGAQALLGIA